MQLNCDDYSEEIIYCIESGISSCNDEKEVLEIFVEAMKNFRNSGKIKEYTYEKCEVADTYKTITFSYQPNIEKYINENMHVRKIVLIGTENKSLSISGALNSVKAQIGEKVDKNKPYKEFSMQMDKILEDL